MSVIHHVVGKLIFQIKVPDQSAAQGVFQQVSDLCSDRLLSLLDRIFQEAGYPANEYIAIDRLVVPVGVISKSQMDSEMLQAFEKEMRKLLPAFRPAGDQPSRAVSSPAARKLLLLEYFLRHGRYPWWATSKADSPGEMDILLSGLASDKMKLARLLERLLSEPVVHRRFLQQIIAIHQTRHALLAALFHESPSDIDLWVAEMANRFTAKSKNNTTLWEAVVITALVFADKPAGPVALKERLLIELDRGEGTAGLQKTVDTPEIMFPANALETSSSTDAPAIPSRSQELEAVLYFLKTGRFPDGFLMSPDKMNEVLIGWLQNAPVQARAELLQLNESVNLAYRLEQQFSTDTVKVLFGVLFPEQSVILNQLLFDIALAVSRRLKGQIEPGFIWYSALTKLLTKVDRRIHFSVLFDIIGTQIGAKTATSPDLVWSLTLLPELRKKSYSAVTRHYLQLHFGTLTSAQTKDLAQQIKQWPSKTDSRATVAFARLFSRLHHTESSWWDTDSVDTARLLHDLTLFSRSDLSDVLSHLLQDDIADKWLPALQKDTFYQILRVIWGNLAENILAFEKIADGIAAEKKVTFQKVIWWKTLLQDALQNNPVTAETLYTLSLLGAALATGRSIKDWENWLDEKSYSPEFKNIYLSLKPADLGDLIEKKSKPAKRNQKVKSGQLSYFDNVETPLPYPDRVKQDLFTVMTFFNQGIIPPGAVISSPEDLEYILMRLLHKHPLLILPLLKESLRHQNAVDRLLHFFSVQLWRETGKAIFGNDFIAAQKHWSGLLHQLHIPLQRTSSQHLERYFYAALFSTGIPLQHTGFDEKIFLTKALTIISKEERIKLSELFKFLKEPGTEQQPEVLAAAEAAIQQTNPEKEFPLQNTGLVEESVYIQNAGLVILAPYLTRYFDTLGMLENNEFRNQEAAERSVHLLQYIASNQSETPEHLLVFNKILCGLPLETPVPIGIALTQEEKDLSAFLLNTVLQNWDKMKTSTVANLQATFLLRNGRLVEKPDKWLLNIEKKAFDILLDFIPWTFSMIKLPWMEKRIEVTWNKKS